MVNKEILKANIVEKDSGYGKEYGKEYHLKLPPQFKLNWAYFHKAFRQMDGKNDEENKLITDFYKAYRDLPEYLLEIAEGYLLELQYSEVENGK